MVCRLKLPINRQHQPFKFYFITKRDEERKKREMRNGGRYCREKNRGYAHYGMTRCLSISVLVSFPVTVKGVEVKRDCKPI
jgi:hypothetical protein